VKIWVKKNEGVRKGYAIFKRGYKKGTSREVLILKVLGEDGIAGLDG